MKRGAGSNFVIWLCIATAFLVVSVRVYMVRKSRPSRPGSVADLVRRGQLRSDRRGMYDFNPQCFLLLSSALFLCTLLNDYFTVVWMLLSIPEEGLPLHGLYL